MSDKNIYSSNLNALRDVIYDVCITRQILPSEAATTMLILVAELLAPGVTKCSVEVLEDENHYRCTMHTANGDEMDIEVMRTSVGTPTH